MNSLRRTVKSNQCLTVPQLAGRHTFPAEVRFQSHDRLCGIYGRQGTLEQYFLQAFWFSPASYQSTKGTQFYIIRS